jgi:hypothetical protein
MGLRSGVQEMAGRDARRYQIVGTGVAAGLGFPRTRDCLSPNDGQSRVLRGTVPPKKGLLRAGALAMTVLAVHIDDFRIKR